MIEQIIDKLRCPNCRNSDKAMTIKSVEVICSRCDSAYPISSGRPVLLRRDNELFATRNYAGAEKRVSSRKSRLKQLIPSASVNLSQKRVLKTIGATIDATSNGAILVVGSGMQRADLQQQLEMSGPSDLVCCDIDVNSDVDLFCDAHELPFADGVFEAVITMAVLEHVMYPERAAAEITRVLAPGGMLYSELPFIQQVHEGAYDFTRYTLSGHRRLFNWFEEIEAGMVAGPGTALVWTIENFATSFFSGTVARTVAKSTVRLLFWWIKYFDLILYRKAAAMDAASCTFFFGRKSSARISDADIVEKYVGSRHLRHI